LYTTNQHFTDNPQIRGDNTQTAPTLEWCFCHNLPDSQIFVSCGAQKSKWAILAPIFTLFSRRLISEDRMYAFG